MTYCLYFYVLNLPHKPCNLQDICETKIYRVSLKLCWAFNQSCVFKHWHSLVIRGITWKVLTRNIKQYSSFLDGKVFAGSSFGPCTTGNYFFTALPKTNLYLLVIEDWTRFRQSYFYNFNCRISNRVFDAGAYRIVNGTCKHIEVRSPKHGLCPTLRNIHLKCSYNQSKTLSPVTFLILLTVLLLIWR